MALNPKTVQFLQHQLDKAPYTSYPGVVAQLISYLSAEVKDNPIYDQFERDRTKWKEWPGEDDDSGWPDWSIPNTLDEGKSLAFHIYKSIAENNEHY